MVYIGFSFLLDHVPAPSTTISSLRAIPQMLGLWVLALSGFPSFLISGTCTLCTSKCPLIHGYCFEVEFQLLISSARLGRGVGEARWKKGQGSSIA